MPTREFVEKRFWEIHDKLPLSVRGKLQLYWNNKKPIISTKKADIDAFASMGRISKAGTTGHVFFFRLDNISDVILDRLIVHEIAHAYIFARDGTSIFDYFDRFKMDKDEREAGGLTQIWLAYIATQP